MASEVPAPVALFALAGVLCLLQSTPDYTLTNIYC